MLKLNPVFKDYIWGGNRLKSEYNKKYFGDRLAESWELACHRDGVNTIEGGPFDGMPLDAYLSEHPGSIGENHTNSSSFPLMIKLIDAARPLSVQVHPGDDYARLHENQLGKTEMWYILDAVPEAYIYIGFNKQTSAQEVETRIADGTIEEILHREYVKKGDSFLIRPGTIHAINGGILLAEIQQSSSVTYRVYDYGRLDSNGKPRELHLQKALDVLDYRAFSPEAKGDCLCRCRYFCVDSLSDNLFVNEDSFAAVLITQGSGQIFCGNEQLSVKKGDCVYIDANSGKVNVCGRCKGLVTTMDD